MLMALLYGGVDVRRHARQAVHQVVELAALHLHSSLSVYDPVGHDHQPGATAALSNAVRD
jgi:hypothetical protein